MMLGRIHAKEKENERKKTEEAAAFSQSRKFQKLKRNEASSRKHNHSSS